MDFSGKSMSDSGAVQPCQFTFSHGAMCYDAGRVTLPSPALFDPTLPESNAVAITQGGRQAAWFVDGDFGRAVLRHYRRGGMIARISADRYIWRGAKATRSMAEFRILCRMHEAGLSVPRPIAAAYWRSNLTYRAAILIERIEQARTLTEIVRDAPLPDQTVDQVARAIFAMHTAGFWHADLNAYNILLDHHGKAWLIDFDKGLQGPVSSNRRIQNLHRLRRSLRKVASHAGDVWWKDINRAYNTFQVSENGPVS